LVFLALGFAMADVFISYAKADRPLALKLAAMLEAEGWTTWWDTSLTIGDDFRNEIMTELGRAPAVIVIWTDTSINLPVEVCFRGQIGMLSLSFAGADPMRSFEKSHTAPFRKPVFSD
jgi:TIR domain